MKKYLVVLILLACIAPAFAQQGYLDKIADSACKCFDTVKDKIKNGDDFDREAESCISTAMMPYLDSISKDENIAITDLDTEVGARIGQKIGVKLAGTCPVFMKLVTDYALDKDAGDVVTGTSTGLVTAVQLTGHLYLDIKESSGKIIKVLWVQNFPGADAYKSNPSSLKGKRITVEWKQEEIYFIAKKDFAIVRVITKLSVK